jgi:hypothetical protein
MEPKGEGSEDRGAVGAGFAEQRFVDMLQAALGGDPMAREKRKLRRPMHQRFQRSEPVGRRDLPDVVHSRMDIEGREASSATAELGEAFADLVPHWPELVASHYSSPVEATVAPKG